MALRAATNIILPMSYIALARSWRPRIFSELIGQEAIKKALINSLDQKRLHHAYLFTGTRGVGKTSIARLFAKALNCEKGVSSTPCLQCNACEGVEQGNFIDLIEIDGASKTRVEDTRELLENVDYAPVVGRFKIYLIDEVHMLSQHSFNALLKTLEEPPEHVKFLLATTDPQKLPLTVLSRLLQFHLKPLTDELISTQLQQILVKENITFDISGINLLAKAAKGSMRDALSLLDQIITGIDSHIAISDVRIILGYTQKDYALYILIALAELSAEKLLNIAKEIAKEGGNVIYVLEELIGYLHKIAIYQILEPQYNEPKNIKDKNAPFTGQADDIKTLSLYFSPEEIQLFYQIGVKGLEELHLAPSRMIGFEMTLLRMYAFMPSNCAPSPSSISNITNMSVNTEINTNNSSKSLPKEPTANVSTTPEQKATEIKSETETEIEIEIKSENTNSLNNKQEKTLIHTEENTISNEVEAELIKNICDNNEIEVPNSTNTEITPENWKDIIPELKLIGLSLNIALHSSFISKNNNNILLKVHPKYKPSLTPTITKRIEDGLSNYYKEKIRLTIEENQQSTKNSLKNDEHFKNDEFFKQLQQEFSAALVKNSITVTEDDL